MSKTASVIVTLCVASATFSVVFGPIEPIVWRFLPATLWVVIAIYALIIDRTQRRAGQYALRLRALEAAAAAPPSDAGPPVAPEAPLNVSVLEGWLKVVNRDVFLSRPDGPSQWSKQQEIWLSGRPLAEILPQALSYRQELPIQLFGLVRLTLERLPDEEQDESAWAAMWLLEGEHIKKVQALDVSERYGAGPGTRYKIAKHDHYTPYLIEPEWPGGQRILFPTLAEAAAESVAVLRRRIESNEAELAHYEKLARGGDEVELIAGEERRTE